MLKTTEKKSKDIKSQFIIVGSLLFILLGISIIGIKYFLNYEKNRQEEKEITNFINEQKEIIESNHDSQSSLPKEDNNYQPEKEEYVAVIEIPKINLKKGLYSKDSKKNNVNNIEILKESDMPDIKNGNFILAGHSGTSRISYFKNLHKLETNDKVYIYYNGLKLEYRLVKRYEIEKTGIANISRNGKKTTLTLITCKDNSNKQLVFIFELEKDGE